MAQSERVGEGTRLQTAAFEAINDVVRVATADTLPLVVQLIPLFISKLSSTLHLQAASAESTERQSEIQARVRAVIAHSKRAPVSYPCRMLKFCLCMLLHQSVGSLCRCDTAAGKSSHYGVPEQTCLCETC